MNFIDLQILPRKAQDELIEFYNFLVSRYGVQKKKNNSLKAAKERDISNFFDSYEIDLEGFYFNRNEIYER